MTEAVYARKGKIIITLSTGQQEVFQSINKAKAASHGIQMDADEGNLGRGTVRRIPHKPPKRAPIVMPVSASRGVWRSEYQGRRA